jgi:plastocyanin
MPARLPGPRGWLTGIALLGLALLPGPAWSVEPGVDIAAPRLSLSTVDDFTTAFHPADLLVEPEDYIRWKDTSTSAFPLFHTTTCGARCSAAACNAGAPWNVDLTQGTRQFTIQFGVLETAPRSIDYFCSPHCLIGMSGRVVLTVPIAVSASYASGTLTLTWTGGGALAPDVPRFRVFRSDNPRFLPGTGTEVLTPDGSDTGTSFRDFAQPATGTALYYLVKNKFPGDGFI